MNLSIKKFLKPTIPKASHRGISLVSYTVKLGTSFDLRVKIEIWYFTSTETAFLQFRPLLGRGESKTLRPSFAEMAT